MSDLSRCVRWHLYFALFENRSFGRRENYDSQANRSIAIEWLLVCIVLFLAITWVHGERIQNNWSLEHWEDQLFFSHVSQFVDPWYGCFTQPSLWPGLYRPLTTNCYYALGGQLWAHQIEWYHAINVLFHAFNASLLYLLTRQLLAIPYALLAMALFASRHAHVEIVTNTVEFQALAATFFALAALLLFMQMVQRQQWRLLPAVCLLLLSTLLSKEANIVVVFIFPLYAWLFARPLERFHLLAVCIGLVAAGIFVLFVRTFVGDEATGFTYAETTFEILRNASAHFWSFANWLARDAENVVMPDALQEMATSPTGLTILLLFMVATLFLGATRRHSSTAGRTFAFGGIIFLVTISPFSFFADRLFMRYGYFSHAGLALAIAALTALGIATLRQRWPQRSV